MPRRITSYNSVSLYLKMRIFKSATVSHSQPAPRRGAVVDASFSARYVVDASSRVRSCTAGGVQGVSPR
jgi:hypothetical protein